jgi:uncharacterized protein YjdB
MSDGAPPAGGGGGPIYGLGQYQLSATVTPTEAYNKSVTYSSDNTSIATVNSDGLITGINAGNTIIRVTTVDGNYQATCNVNIILGRRAH